MTHLSLPGLLSGKPIFEHPCLLVKPYMPKRSVLSQYLDQLEESRFLSNQGKLVLELEREIAKKAGTKHCAVFCNGTLAAICLLQAMDLKGEVITPSFTFLATTHSLVWAGLRPKFVDINKDDFTLDIDQVEEAITPSVCAIHPVNLFGGTCNYDDLVELARKKDLPLIFDSAQAFGTQYKNRQVGNNGLAEIFSFHATKSFHTGEGGAVVTNNTQVYERMVKIRNFGFETTSDCEILGINGKMNEFQAMVGLSQLGEIEGQITNRKNVFEIYQKELNQVSGLQVVKFSDYVNSNYSYCCVLVDPEVFGLSNIELRKALVHDNIISRCYFAPPVHQTTYYKQHFPHINLKNTDWASARIISLPIYAEMTFEEQSKIINAVKTCHEYAGDVRKKLKESET